MTPAGQLVGCELLTRFHCEDLPVLNSKYFIMTMTVEGRKELLKQQLETVEVHASWFREHRLFCTVNVDTVQAGYVSLTGILFSYWMSWISSGLRSQRTLKGLKWVLNIRYSEHC